VSWSAFGERSAQLHQKSYKQTFPLNFQAMFNAAGQQFLIQQTPGQVNEERLPMQSTATGTPMELCNRMLSAATVSDVLRAAGDQPVALQMDRHESFEFVGLGQQRRRDKTDFLTRTDPFLYFLFELSCDRKQDIAFRGTSCRDAFEVSHPTRILAGIRVMPDQHDAVKHRHVTAGRLGNHR
jgi:hypothetical protein